MDLPVAVVCGALFGLLGCVAPAVPFEWALRGGARASVAVGLASCLVSFLVLTGALLAVYIVARAGFFEFGCAMVASFLLFWAVEAVRAWRAANGGRS